MKILGYHATDHFLEQIRMRGIDAMLVSLCLAKGKAKGKARKGVLELSLGSDSLSNAIQEGYLALEELTFVYEFVVVCRQRKLITAYLRRGDFGIGG